MPDASWSVASPSLDSWRQCRTSLRGLHHAPAAAPHLLQATRVEIAITSWTPGVRMNSRRRRPVGLWIRPRPHLSPSGDAREPNRLALSPRRLLMWKNCQLPGSTCRRAGPLSPCPFSMLESWALSASPADIAAVRSGKAEPAVRAYCRCRCTGAVGRDLDPDAVSRRLRNGASGTLVAAIRRGKRFAKE